MNCCFGVLLPLFPLALVSDLFEELLGALEAPRSPSRQALAC